MNLAPLRASRGFTLFETVLVIGLLAVVSAGLLSMFPRIYQTQTLGRDERVALEVQRACAERLVTLRRSTGYTSVANSSCQVLGATGDFTPAVALTVGGAASSPCSGSRCVATITANRANVPAALPALTLELSAY